MWNQPDCLLPRFSGDLRRPNDSAFLCEQWADLARQLREVLDCFRAACGAEVGCLMDRHAHEQLFDRDLHLFVAQRARNGWHGQDLVGHVPRTLSDKKMEVPVKKLFM